MVGGGGGSMSQVDLKKNTNVTNTLHTYPASKGVLLYHFKNMSHVASLLAPSPPVGMCLRKDVKIHEFSNVTNF